MAGPRVSVVIPVHNGGPHVLGAIRSVLDQDYDSLEVVVIDNGSTDGALEALPISDARLIVTRYQDVVPAHVNWTRAVNAARGEYVKLVCADDEVLPGAISAQVEALDAHPTAVLAAGRRRVINANGRVLMESRGLEGMSGLVTGPRAARACVRSGTNPLGEPAAVMFRAPVLRREMPWRSDAGYVIDLDLYLRVLRQGDLWATQSLVSTFRVSIGSWSANVSSQQAGDFRTLASEIESAWPEAVRPRDARRGRQRASMLQMARSILYWNERRKA